MFSKVSSDIARQEQVFDELLKQYELQCLNKVCEASASTFAMDDQLKGLK